MEKDKKKELTEEEKLALIRKFERPHSISRSDKEMLREKNNHKESESICDRHWDGA